MRAQLDDSITLRRLSSKDFESAIAVKEEVVCSIKTPELLVPPSNNFLKALLDGEGASFGAFDSETLVGFVSFRRPDERDNLGLLGGCPLNICTQSWNLEHSLIRKQYRKRGLFHRLFVIGVRQLDLQSSHCYKSISPKNHASLFAAAKENFEIVAFRQLYCSMERFIMHYPASSNSGLGSLAAPLTDVQRVDQLLKCGYIGRFDPKQRDRLLFTK